LSVSEAELDFVRFAGKTLLFLRQENNEKAIYSPPTTNSGWFWWIQNHFESWGKM
jgi:hypothetical protein